MELSRAFEVLDEIVGADLEGSIHANRLDREHMDFTITVSLVDPTEEMLAALASIAERHSLLLAVDDPRLASLK